jgi:hypothetical protein
VSVELMVQPPFGEDWTEISISGEDADEVLNIIVSRFLACEYEVLMEAEDGTMVPYEEYDHG